MFWCSHLALHWTVQARPHEQVGGTWLWRTGGRRGRTRRRRFFSSPFRIFRYETWTLASRRVEINTSSSLVTRKTPSSDPPARPRAPGTRADGCTARRRPFARRAAGGRVPTTERQRPSPRSSSRPHRHGHRPPLGRPPAPRPGRPLAVPPAGRIDLSSMFDGSYTVLAVRT